MSAVWIRGICHVCTRRFSCCNSEDTEGCRDVRILSPASWLAAMSDLKLALIFHSLFSFCVALIVSLQRTQVTSLNSDYFDY